jgi:hypothetical protein
MIKPFASLGHICLDVPREDTAVLADRSYLLGRSGLSSVIIVFHK